VFLVLLADFNPRRRLSVIALNLVLIAGILTAFNTAEHFVRFNHWLGDYPAVSRRAEPKKRLLKVAVHQRDPVTNIGALWYMHMFYMYEKGGVTDVQFAQYPHNPVQYRKGMKVPTPVPTRFYRYAAFLTFDHLLDRKSAWVPLANGAADHVVYVDENKDWILFRVLPGPPARQETQPVISPRKGLELPVLHR
jgi:hypothetical protein